MQFSSRGALEGGMRVEADSQLNHRSLLTKEARAVWEGFLRPGAGFGSICSTGSDTSKEESF